ncbi:MAG: 4Fe-4S binding protein [Burkholderiaceae bacterium]|jgi:ferredoxin
MSKCLVCSCNKTMPLDEAAVGQPVHQALCRHEVGVFLEALDQPDDLVVACTQEQALFSALADQKPSAAFTSIRFVNIRETAGWSSQAQHAVPKIKALLAHAQLPQADAVPSVSYTSSGRLLVIGPATMVTPAMQMAAAHEGLSPTALVTAHDGLLPQSRRHPVFTGSLQALTGFLGRFNARWEQVNPIDLDICTRCGACQRVCPEGAISDDFQVDLTRCRSSRDCVRACDAVGAVRFDRLGDIREETFDLVLDLRETPAFGQADTPQGYWHLTDANPLSISQMLPALAAQVGEFEKPKFFKYDQRLCAHGRNAKVGCSACLDVCSTAAIRSVFTDGRGRVEVDPNLCMGCGACATVCPSGAMRYAYPSADRIALEMRNLIRSYEAAGGHSPSLLLHGQTPGLSDASELIEDLGRGAQRGALSGIPAHVIPMGLHHAASVGLEAWLAALCYGASGVRILISGREATSYREALAQQVGVAQSLLRMLGLREGAISLVEADDAAALDLALAGDGPDHALVKSPAGFALGDDKRAALEACLEHLMVHGQTSTAVLPLPSPLPAGAPLGGLQLDLDRCTLCMSCVGACPEAALKAGGDRPLLAFIERNCVQCGLCVQTCPESALALDPRLAPLADRREALTLHESQPFCCVKCGRPFATKQGLQAMLLRLGSHPAFQGDGARRLEMCGDCRVVDMVEKS